MVLILPHQADAILYVLLFHFKWIKRIVTRNGKNEGRYTPKKNSNNNSKQAPKKQTTTNKTVVKTLEAKSEVVDSKIEPATENTKIEEKKESVESDSTETK